MDHLIGIILLGLGIASPLTGNVLGIMTTSTTSALTTATGSATGGTTTVSPTYMNFRTQLYEDKANFLQSMQQRQAMEQQQLTASMSAFRANLAKIRDARKQALVDKLNTLCENVNQRRTTRMSDMLTRLTDILTNITNRAATAQANGKDISSVTTAITAAQSAITTAQNAVAAQAATPCVLSFQSENTLRADVGYTISTMQLTLKGVYNQVLAARTAVIAALKALATVTGESLTGGPTSATASGAQK